LRFSQTLAFPCLRGRVVHFIDENLAVAMGTPKSKRVESCAQDDDLPNTSFDSCGQRVLCNPASCGGEQTSDAGQGMCVRKLQHLLLVFAQNRHGERVMED